MCFIYLMITRKLSVLKFMSLQHKYWQNCIKGFPVSAQNIFAKREMTAAHIISTMQLMYIYPSKILVHVLVHCNNMFSLALSQNSFESQSLTILKKLFKVSLKVQMFSRTIGCKLCVNESHSFVTLPNRAPRKSSFRESGL